MASSTSSFAIGSGDGADAVGDVFQLVAQLQEALILQKQETERRVQEAERRMQEALRQHNQEAERKVQEAEGRMQEALRQQNQEAERKVHEAERRMQEERAATALREVERKLQEKDDAIRALQQRLQEMQESMNAVEERRTTPEGSAGEEDMERLQRRVNQVEASLQSALQKFLPRVEALLNQLKEPQSARASLATAAASSAASAREAPASGGAAAGGGEESGWADEEQCARRRVELRVREVDWRARRARTSPSPLAEQLCKAAEEGRLNDVRQLLLSYTDINYTDGCGFTPLHHAAMNGHTEVMSLLLQRGADVHAVDLTGTSALHWAAIKDRSGRRVELLVRAGADVNARNIDGETPLHWAAQSNNEEAVRALLHAGARRDVRSWGEGGIKVNPFEIATICAVQDLLRG